MIDQLLSEDPPAGTAVALPQTKCDADPEKKRARLAAIVAGGTAKKYLGKQPTLAQIDEMTDVEIQKYYTRYEARLGASMTKTLGNSALQMYALAAGRFLPIPPENHTQLVADLEDDPLCRTCIDNSLLRDVLPIWNVPSSADGGDDHS